MHKYLIVTLLLLSVPMHAQVLVKPGEEIRPIKPMNAVNNGPIVARKSQTRSNYESFKAARIPYARTHDTALYSGYGGHHSVDISAVFPDFEADVDSPESYDFKVTDKFISDVYSAGTEIFFRLGQSIENWAKKYDVWPPKDYKKWARICEHVIMHYNKGWAEGYHYGIEYWEIWNEADLDRDEKDWKNAPRNWGGSPQQFFEFFEVAAKHLHRRFPELKIGGPALCGSLEWAEDFLSHMKKHRVPLDFFSWHCYSNTPESIVAMSDKVDALLEKYGYSSSESILDEWNYLRDWSDNFVYTVERVNSIKGGAFCASVMSACQDAGTDMLMYYDLRPSTSFCGVYDAVSLKPQPAYYAFYLWSRLRDYPMQVKTCVDSGCKGIYATAATGEGKGLAVMVVRFNDDDNVSSSMQVEIKIESGIPDCTVYAHLTDDVHVFTEIPVEIKGGVATLLLAPQSFVFLEIPQ